MSDSTLCTPPEIIEAASQATLEVLPEKSKERYLAVYNNLKLWCNVKIFKKYLKMYCWLISWRKITNLEMLFILLVMFYSLSVTNEQNTEKFFIEEECVNLQTIEIMKSYFSTRQCLSIIYLSQNIYVPNEYFSFSNLPQVVRRQNENEYKPIMNMALRPRRDFLTLNGTIKEFCEERLEGFVLFSPNLQILNSYAFSNMVSAFMNPRAYVFIHVRESLTTEQISPFFVLLWHVYRAPHISVTCCTCTHVFTPSARHHGGVAAHTLDHVTADISDISRKLNYLHGLPFRTCMFPSVMAKPVYAKNGLVVEYEGVDRMMVDLLAEKINFTKVLISNNDTYGRRKTDGSFNGALGLLVTGSVDMASVGFFAMDYQTRDVEPTQGVQVDDLCAVVHKAKEVPPWLAPVRYIGFDVCVVLALVYLGVAGVWIAIRRFEFPRKKFDTSEMFFNTFRLMLATSIPRLSDTTCERFFLAFCSAAFVTLAGTFQGSLVTVYSTQFFYKDVNSLADLAETQLPILTRFEAFKNDIFTNESSPTREKLKEMVKIYSGNISINTMVAETGKVGGLVRRSSMDLDSQVLLYQDSKGSNLLHLVKECVRTYNLAYMLPRASAFSFRINEIILRASQAGLFEKWYQDMAANNTKCRGSSKKDSRTQGRNQSGDVPLSLEDLQLAMYGLGVGMFVSLLAFVFETVHVHFWIQLRCVFTRRRLSAYTK